MYKLKFRSPNFKKDSQIWRLSVLIWVSYEMVVYIPRQVGSVLIGIEPWQLLVLSEQTRWTNKGGISGSGASSTESPSRMLKESSSWFTVFDSLPELSPTPSSMSPSSASSFPWSWYSTSRSVSLSDTMQQPDTFSENLMLRFNMLSKQAAKMFSVSEINTNMK